MYIPKEASLQPIIEALKVWCWALLIGLIGLTAYTTYNIFTLIF